MKFRILYLFVFFVVISCSKQEARRPISASSSGLLESTTALLKKINTIEEIKIKFQGVEEISSPDTTLLTNNHFIGSSSIGVIFSGCHYVKVDSIDISNINALNGVAFGNVVNNKCNYVNLFNLNIYNLLSKSCCIESSALTIDHLAKNIQINNTNVH